MGILRRSNVNWMDEAGYDLHCGLLVKQGGCSFFVVAEDPCGRIWRGMLE